MHACMHVWRLQKGVGLLRGERLLISSGPARMKMGMATAGRPPIQYIQMPSELGGCCGSPAKASNSFLPALARHARPILTLISLLSPPCTPPSRQPLIHPDRYRPVAGSVGWCTAGAVGLTSCSQHLLARLALSCTLPGLGAGLGLLRHARGG